MTSTVVTLNVGGQVFQTTRGTLLRHDNSYFTAMLSSSAWQPDAQGAYFIDLDPTHFGRILNYMRFGDLVLDGLPDWDTNQVMRMLQYLSLDTPPHLGLLWDAAAGGRNTLTNQCRTITAAASFKSYAALGWHSADSYSVHIDAIIIDLERPAMRIGFANRDSFDPTEPLESGIDVRLIGPAQLTHLGEPTRPPHVLFANVGDIITVSWSRKDGRVVGCKHGDVRTKAIATAPLVMSDDDPFPCVSLRAVQTVNFASSKREWVQSQVSLTETPP